MELKKIKVLHVAQAAGGVDRYLRSLLKYMDKDAFENIVVVSKDFKESDYRGVADAFEYIDMTREIGLHDLKSIAKVRKIIRSYKPDIVYAHSSKAGAITRIADVGLKNHCIYNPHGWAFNMRCSKKKKTLYKFIEKVASPFCDRIICISEAEKISAEKNRICELKKLQVINNGVDIEEYEESPHGAVNRSILGIPNDAVVIGMVGRISAQKAPDVFIRAAKLIKEKIPKAHFLIVGSGEQQDDVIKYADDNGFSDSLHITGWVDNPMSYIELFDIACLLSRWEGFGLVLPEYMMAQKPIVATCVDAIPYIITDRKNGLLVAVDDACEVSEKVIELYKDERLRRSIINSGYEIVKNLYDVKRVVYEHEKLFQNIAGGET